MSQVRKDVLNGWKEIANYVGRDIRTVERWEKHRGLPIRRVPGEGRATVYAVVSELERWFTSANAEEPLNSDSATTSSTSIGNITVIAHGNGADRVEPPAIHLAEDAAVAPSKVRSQTAVAEKSAPRWRVPLAIGLAATAAAVLILKFSDRLPVHGSSRAGVNGGVKYSFDATRTTPGVPYPSRVPGVDDLYLRGVYFYEQRTAASLKHAEEYFSEAIAKDPNYAPAFAGLSNNYNLEREYSVMPDEVAYPKAKEAAERAIALDPRLPQAHTSLGFIDFFWSGDPVGAEREFRRAIELDPSLVIAHHWYGSVLTQEGRYPAAIEQLDIAQRLQPTSAAVLSSRALALGASGHRGEAVDMLQELLNEAPQATSPHQMLAILTLVEPRDIPRWLQESRFVAKMRSNSDYLKQLDIAEAAYRSGGEPAMWKAMIKNEERLHPPPQTPSYQQGLYEAALGDNDAAFAILMPAAMRHDRNAVIMGMDPLLKDLREDPRFKQMFAYTGVPAAAELQ